MDESNVAFNTRLGFFLYGGIAIKDSEIREQAKFLCALKAKHGIPKHRPLKWSNVAWGKQGVLDNEKHREMKDAVLKHIQASDIKIIVYLAPQEFYHIRGAGSLRQVIHPDKQATAMQYAITGILDKFNHYLTEQDDIGLVVADEFGTKALRSKLLPHCFSVYPDGTNVSDLERIVYCVLCVDSEYSLMHQINDIVLGAIQHSLREIAHNFLPILKDNFWALDYRGKPKIVDAGFTLYPRTARTLRIRGQLTQLEAKFIRLVGQ
jgi:hypothetical protein